MPLEVHYFVCEVCKNIFSSKATARECEEWHSDQTKPPPKVK